MDGFFVIDVIFYLLNGHTAADSSFMERGEGIE